MKYSFNSQFPSSKTSIKSESLKKNTNLKTKLSFNSTSEFNLSQSVYKPFSNTSYNLKLSKINTSDCFSKKGLSSTLASSLMSKRSIHSGNCEQRKSCILKEIKLNENTVKQEINLLRKGLNVKDSVKQMEMRESLSNPKEWIQCTYSFHLQTIYKQHDNSLAEYINKNQKKLNRFLISSNGQLDEYTKTNGLKKTEKNSKCSTDKAPRDSFSQENVEYYPLPNKVSFRENNMKGNIEKKYIIHSERKAVASRRIEYISSLENKVKKTGKTHKNELYNEENLNEINYSESIKEFRESGLSLKEKIENCVNKIQRVWKGFFYNKYLPKIIYIQKAIRGFFCRSKIISVSFLKEIKNKFNEVDHVISLTFLRKSFQIIKSFSDSKEYSDKAFIKQKNESPCFQINKKFEASSSFNNYLLAKSCLENILINVYMRLNNKENEENIKFSQQIY